MQLATRHLEDFLKQIIKDTKVKKINFIAHSMGNMVLLQALDGLVKENSALRDAIGEIIAASPDADPDVMKALIGSISPTSAGITLYASHNDRALWLRNLFTSYTRAGYIGDKPLIIPGVDTIDISGTGNYFSFNHDLYAASPVLVANMRRLFGEGTRPPHKRSPEFEPGKINDGTYWRLRSPAQ
jgi:esterase/lipase superfamily enzyme